MRIGPRYKIARRLGADLFEKTSTAKYAARAARKGKRLRRGGGSRSDFGAQLREKQRARMLYGIGERQFARYVANAIARRAARDDETLFVSLETRLDNVLYRLGIAPTRQAARQYAAHGHFTVNGRRVTIPSYRVAVGDTISVRSGSRTCAPFQALADSIRDHITPPWLRFDAQKGEATVASAPKLVKSELPFNIAAILGFYRR